MSDEKWPGDYVDQDDFDEAEMELQQQLSGLEKEVDQLKALVVHNSSMLSELLLTLKGAAERPELHECARQLQEKLEHFMEGG